jgi:hypothetical protein
LSTTFGKSAPQGEICLEGREGLGQLPWLQIGNQAHVETGIGRSEGRECDLLELIKGHGNQGRPDTDGLKSRQSTCRYCDICVKEQVMDRLLPWSPMETQGTPVEAQQV